MCLQEYGIAGGVRPRSAGVTPTSGTLLLGMGRRRSHDHSE